MPAPVILVATDFTPSSRPAFDHGLALAKELGGRLLLVHAMRPLGAPGLELTRPDTTKVENETAEPVPAVGLAGTEWVDLARSQGVEADAVVRPGLPTVVILEEADRVDARTIVLGSQEKDRLAKAILGSVSEDVQGRTQREVVVVPPGDAPARPARPTRRERLGSRRKAQDASAQVPGPR
jgi:nucleotide-binding universal stress UspA family protein